MSLRREQGRIILRRRTWRGRHPSFEVHPLCAVILALLDGNRSKEDVAHIIGQLFDFAPETAAKTMRLTLRIYRRFLTDRERLEGRQPVTYDPTEFVMAAPPPPRRQPRQPVPQWVSWRVTRYCNRHCTYCGMAAPYAEQAPDASFPFDRAREIFTEGVDIGVRGVALGGGEPFIRPDMVDLIELLLQLEYEVDIDTRFALSDAQIGRLAAAGLPLIHVSLDSPHAETANHLVGDNTFFETITRSIRSLVAHGIRVAVNAVLTEINVRQLPELAKFAVDLGVEQITLNASSRALSAESAEWLRGILPALQSTSAGEHADESPAPLPSQCDHGIRVLRVLPDGRVSRCGQSLYEEDAVFGDLRKQSLYEVWSSPALLAMLYPPRKRFGCTACEECGLFDTCGAAGPCLIAPDNHFLLRRSV